MKRRGRHLPEENGRNRLTANTVAIISCRSRINHLGNILIAKKKKIYKDLVLHFEIMLADYLLESSS